MNRGPSLERARSLLRLGESASEAEIVAALARRRLELAAAIERAGEGGAPAELRRELGELEALDFGGGASVPGETRPAVRDLAAAGTIAAAPRTEVAAVADGARGPASASAGSSAGAKGSASARERLLAALRARRARRRSRAGRRWLVRLAILLAAAGVPLVLWATLPAWKGPAATLWRTITRDAGRQQSAIDARREALDFLRSWEALRAAEEGVGEPELEADARRALAEGEGLLADALDDPARARFQAATESLQRAMGAVRREKDARGRFETEVRQRVEAVRGERARLSSDPAQRLEAARRRAAESAGRWAAAEGEEKARAEREAAALHREEEVATEREALVRKYVFAGPEAAAIDPALERAESVLRERKGELRFVEGRGAVAEAEERLRALAGRLADVDAALSLRETARREREEIGRVLREASLAEPEAIGRGEALLAEGAKTLEGGDLSAARAQLQNAANQIGRSLLRVPEEYPTVQSAIDAAQAGEVVRLSAGTHAGPVRFKEGVVLVGTSREESVIATDGVAGEVLVVSSCRTGYIARLTLLHREGTAERLARQQRRSLLDLSASDVTVAEVTLRGGAGVAIAIHRGGKPTVRDSRIEACHLSGIYVIDAGSEPRLLRNRCLGMGESGIFFAKGAKGLAEENSCEQNGGHGIGVGQSGSAPLLRRNRLSGNRQGGIVFAQGAGGEAEENLCLQNSRAGIAAADPGTAPLLRQNTARGNEVGGIIFSGGAAGEALLNICEENGSVGIGVSDAGTRPSLMKNISRKNPAGISVKGRASPRATGNQCDWNRGPGIQVSGGGTAPELRGNECRHNEGAGFLFEGGAGGVSAGNIAEGNHGSGFLISGASTAPELSGNQAKGNDGWGLELKEGARLKGEGAVAASGNRAGEVQAP